MIMVGSREEALAIWDELQALQFFITLLMKNKPNLP
jgi:hypothetical protein